MDFKKGARKYFGKFWFLLWKDESFKGWIFSIIFLFVFIKFIFFPGLSLITGTSLPLAIVESCSMYHDRNLIGNFNSWFERHDEKYSAFEIEKNNFENFDFKKGLNKGDILFVVGTNPEKIKVGDVIIFNANQRNPIIHRIIGMTEVDGKKVFSTIGDNNEGQISFEKSISEDELVGKPVLKIAPYLGWIKLVFFEGAKNPPERGFCLEN